VACRINNRLAPLSEPLQSGQTVEIITAAGARPNPAWFNYAITAKARTNIRHFLKQQKREDSVALGERLLDRVLTTHDSSIAKLKGPTLDAFLTEHHYQTLEDLLVDVAQGERLPSITAQQLLGKTQDGNSTESKEAIAIRGTEGFMVTYAKCCHPLPGDPIAGYLSSEKGVVVHRENCKNLGEFRETPERLVALRWHNEIEGDYIAALKIEVENRRGVIAVIATRINSMDINIEKIATGDKDHLFALVDLELQVQSRVHLARVMKRLRNIDGVRKVTRVKN
jgi:guanosine-3',5'-bis(diphosphate) 3'-pyrophosphohydrolase